MNFKYCSLMWGLFCLFKIGQAIFETSLTYYCVTPKITIFFPMVYLWKMEARRPPQFFHKIS